MKRKKPPQDHTADAPEAFTAQVIGHVRSPYKERFGPPRQPTVTAQTLADAAVDATIELLPATTMSIHVRHFLLAGAQPQAKPRVTFNPNGETMTTRVLTFALIAVALFASACESTRKIKDDIKDDVTSRSIDRARVHTAADVKAAYDKEGGDADETLLLFFNALLLIEEDQPAGYAAAAYLSRKNDQWEDKDGPTGVKPSQAAAEGLGRVWENPERVHSYVGGEPTDYKLGKPETMTLEIKETRNTTDTEKKYFVWSSGKDSASPVTMRIEGGKWYIDEWSSIQTGVRK